MPRVRPSPPRLYRLGMTPVHTTKPNAVLTDMLNGSGGGGGSVGVALGPVNTVFASPVFIAHDTTVTALMVYVWDSLSTGNMRIGLYADNGTGYPGRLRYGSNAISGSTSGLKTNTLGTPLAVVAGLYWTAYKPESATVNIACGYGRFAMVEVSMDVPSGNDSAAAYTMTTGGAGALPTTFGAFSATSSNSPRIGVKVSR